MGERTYALVVDNSPVIRKIVESVLVKEGWEVQTAENGLEALDFIATRKPDIIFTDLIMPKIDGEKLSYIIRHTPELKDIFLVILSGVAMEDDDRTRQIGADVCIAKGPATHMQKHICSALQMYATGEGSAGGIEGLEGLYPRETTKELLTSKRHRDVILANMAEGVVELNHEGRIVMANRAAIRLFRLEEAKVLGQRIYTLFPEQEQQQVKTWIAALEPTGEIESLLFSYDEPVKIAGNQVVVNFIPVAEGESVFIIGILTDITQRKVLEKRQKKLEKELQRIQKIDAMSVMAGGIAHDFNNLLTIISGNVEMSRFQTKDKRLADLLEEAGKALHLTTELIRTFTTFSDNYLPDKRRVKLIDLITDTLEHELAEYDISLDVEDKSLDTLLRLDASLMHQVLTNLVSNAVDAMNGKGTIRIKMDIVDGEIESGQTGQPLPSGDLVRILFQDNGPGIDPEIIDQVFDPYFSTKEKGAKKGMGLGLTIVHSIVKKHRGMVWVASPPGQGCTVYLYLPVSEALVTDTNLEIELTADKPRILVMDDDEMMRMINKKMFEHFQCEVTLATTGETAVELFQEGEKSGKAFDLTLLDLRTSEGMDGLQTAEALLACNPASKIILISGDAGNEIMINYSQYGFAAALAKPFSLDTVEDLIHRFVLMKK